MNRTILSNAPDTQLNALTPLSDAVTGASITSPGPWLPKGAWDCHVHVFDSRFPFSPDRRFTPSNASLLALREMRQRLRLDHSVIVQASVYGSDNSLLVESLERAQGLLRGVAVIDQEVSDEQLQRMNEAGVRGVRLNLETFGVIDPEKAGAHLRALAERIQRFGWHIQIHSRLAVFVALKAVLANLSCRVVIDHFGGVQAAGGVAQPDFDEFLELLAGANVYLKLSAPSRISQLTSQEDIQPIIKELLKVRSDRLLWGSDWPHTGGLPGQIRQRDVIEPFMAIDDGANLNQLASWITDPNQRLEIWQTNPETLYG